MHAHQQPLPRQTAFHGKVGEATKQQQQEVEQQVAAQQVAEV